MPFRSYATVAQADNLAEFRVGGAAWIALQDEQKEQALVTATRDIDTLEDYPGFVGDRTDDAQLFAFPRDGDTEYPDKVVQATIEYAMTFVPLFATGATGDPLNQDPQSGNIKSETIGPIKTEYFAARDGSLDDVERLPAMVQRLLYGFLIRVDMSPWGRASVSRGT